MKKWLLPLLFIAACAGGPQVATMDSFYTVSVGSSSAEVTQALGAPYAEKQLPDGTVEYEYIEKLNVGARTLQERHYYLILKDGKVVSKRIEQDSPPPYTFDSYQMQTTQVN